MADPAGWPAGQPAATLYPPQMHPQASKITPNSNIVNISLSDGKMTQIAARKQDKINSDKF